MSEGFIPAAEPAQPEPTGTEPQPSAEGQPGQAPAAAGRPAGDQPSATAPTADPATPTAKRYRVLGKEYTLAELEAQGLLDQLDNKFTQAEQVAHYQRLFEQQKERAAELERERQAQAGQAITEDAGPTSEQLVALYQPSIEAAVKAGIIEPDIASAYPRTAARLFYLSDIVARQGKALAEMVSGVQKAYATGRGNQVRQYLDSQTEAVSKKGPAFSPLADPQTREAFYQWLGDEVNPPASAINEEFLARMWAAYKHTEWIGVAETAAATQRDQDEARRRQAQGEGGSARPAGAPEKSKHDQDMEEMAEGFLPPVRR